MRTTKHAKRHSKVAKAFWFSSFASFVALFASFVVAFEQQAPKRIISLVPALTEMLYAIGAGPQVVAVSSYDDEPAAVQALPRVGALLDPDTERILSLRPDLVVVYGSQADLQAHLARASIPIFNYRHAGLADIVQTMRQLGERTGHQAEANAVATAIEHRIGAVRARVGRHRRPRTLLVFGRERQSLRNLYASGGKGFLNDMLVAAGGDNVFADVDREAVQGTTELLLARAPEVILELRSEAMTPGNDLLKERAVWNALPSIPAVKNGRVIILTGKGLTVPGPRVADSVEQMAKALHP